ncbi:MAG: aminoacetone oxidase family FAD-binding enzyme [bacterium]|nr:aminoacetone oxidase family FAD-binding enzyme [bacterium]
MKSNEPIDVVVIGGGPAGMMAAGRAAEKDKSVLLLEKNQTLGKKLLITGGGRCNVTNNKPNIREILAKYKESDKFLFSAFSQFGVTETIVFFGKKGMQMKEENEGRMFPVSNKAETVLNVLVKYIKNAGVKVKTNSAVTKISFDQNLKQFSITLADKSIIHAHKCIVATGGTSRPETGSTGEGFKWLKDLGHTVKENDVALVPITLKDEWVKRLAGVTLDNVKMTVYKGIEKCFAKEGKLLFTHVGISGPTVLNMSSEVGELLNTGEGADYAEKADVTIKLDLFPNLDQSALKQKLQTILTEQSNKKIKNTLSMLVKPAMVEPILMLSVIDGETFNHSVKTAERKTLVSLLKAVILNVDGLLGKDKAAVSSGGVILSEVDFKTMQSRILPQLYLVGDVLNINRPSGGYSLQLCWTTGYVAGNSC